LPEPHHTEMAVFYAVTEHVLGIITTVKYDCEFPEGLTHG